MPMTNTGMHTAITRSALRLAKLVGGGAVPSDGSPFGIWVFPYARITRG
jgi:hypothetical protein